MRLGKPCLAETAGCGYDEHGPRFSVQGTYAEDLDVVGGRITWCENTSEIPLSQIILTLQTQYASTELSPM